MDEGIVYVGSMDKHLYAINAATGIEEWRFAADGEFESSPAAFDSIVFIGNVNGNLYAVHAANGQERWHFQTGG